jgi:thiamine pyrophosphokinase
LAQRKALILANGQLTDADILRRRLAPLHFDDIIAADGGARHAAALGLTVDRIVGDFDSLSPAERERLRRNGATALQHPRGKDETDLELALLDAAGAGATEIVVLGATGGRLDMTLANVGLLPHPALRGHSIQLWDGSETAYLLVPPGGEILGDVGDRVSLLPIGGEARGITTHGLTYPLASETLSVGPARGVSNRVAAPSPHVEFTSGALLVVHAPADEGDPHGS